MMAVEGNQDMLSSKVLESETKACLAPQLHDTRIGKLTPFGAVPIILVPPDINSKEKLAREKNRRRSQRQDMKENRTRLRANDRKKRSDL